MNYIAACFAVPATFACMALAQSASQTPENGDPMRLQRKAEAVSAARNFKPGEGDPIPAPMAEFSDNDREAAARARDAEGTMVSRQFVSGEGDPRPEPRTIVARADRVIAEQARRADVMNAMRSGTFPVYGADWGGRYLKK